MTSTHIHSSRGSRPVNWLPRLGLLLAFSLGGLLMSATGVLIGVRRLRRKRSHRVQATACLEAQPHG